MALGPGSIAFTGFNADGGDNVAFVALETIPAGTVIYFQDNEWTGAAFNSGESAFSWTAASDVAAGTVIRIDSVSSTPTTNIGSVTYEDSTNKGLSNDNEILYAFVGTSATAPTAFLSAVTNLSLTNGATLAGTGLTAGVNALELTGGIDIGAYAGSTSNQASFAAYRALLNDPANWTTQNGSGDQSIDGAGPEAPFATSAFTLGGAATQTVRFASASLNLAKAEGDSGSKQFSFTIERTGGSAGAAEVSGTIDPGSTDAADFGGVLPTSFHATIPEGATSTVVTVTVNGDMTIENTESFSLTIDSAANSSGIVTTLGAATAIGTIQNDDADAAIGGITIYDAASSSLTGSTAVPQVSDEVLLVRLGEFTGSGATAAARAESVSFDTHTGRIFVTNAVQNRIDIAQLAADGSSSGTGFIDLAGLPGYGGVNSVAVKNGIVAVAYQNSVGTQPGGVALYDAATGALVKVVSVGVLPDQVTFSPDDSKILVANEGEAVSPGVNPAGSVSIIDVSGGAAAATVSNTISFTALSGNELVLAERGVALFRGQTAANDIEPEYISVSPDGTRAYVTLQEVNAVAVIDLTNPAADRPLAMLPLGGVDRNLDGNEFDGSDQNGIALQNADVIGLLQPDAIASFAVGGATYFVTANEGDARVGGLTDEIRLSSGSYVLDPTAYPDAAALKASPLGRLNVLTNVGDTDGDGDIDQIYTFGGRSITIFRQEADGSITKVAETGGEFEAILANLVPGQFNGENGGAFDSRSDNKGPEPEGVAVGMIGDRLYAFVTLERIGGVMVYDITDPTSPSFVSYKPATAQDHAPETVTFVDASNNPTNRPIVLTANEVSGTTTIYRAVVQNDQDNLIEGAGDADTFTARGGNDTVQGFGGNDRIDGGAGIDTTVYRGARGDYLFEEQEDGSVRITDQRPGSADGSDTVSAIEKFQFSDRVISLETLLTGRTFDAGSGADTVTGTGVRDDLTGGSGNDSVDGGAGNDRLFGGSGNDFVVGGAGHDSLFGEAGTDTLIGGTGNDSLDGGSGDDLIEGGDGSDRLQGGSGLDILTGGAGADYFAISSGDDRVSDFQIGIDHILLEGASVKKVTVADYDRDGSLDIQVKLSSGSIVLLGVGDEPFTQQDLFA